MSVLTKRGKDSILILQDPVDHLQSRIPASRNILDKRFWLLLQQSLLFLQVDTVRRTVFKVPHYLATLRQDPLHSRRLDGFVNRQLKAMGNAWHALEGWQKQEGSGHVSSIVSAESRDLFKYVPLVCNRFEMLSAYFREVAFFGALHGEGKRMQRPGGVNEVYHDSEVVVVGDRRPVVCSKRNEFGRLQQLSDLLSLDFKKLVDSSTDQFSARQLVRLIAACESRQQISNRL